MKKIPPNAEATSVLVGAVDFLQTPVYAFVRLAKGVTIPDLIEVSIPTRFFFIYLDLVMNIYVIMKSDDQ